MGFSLDHRVRLCVLALCLAACSEPPGAASTSGAAGGTTTSGGVETVNAASSSGQGMSSSGGTSSTTGSTAIGSVQTSGAQTGTGGNGGAVTTATQAAGTMAGSGNGTTTGTAGAGGFGGFGSNAAYPFPQNSPSANCIYPSGYDNRDVWDAYQLWKDTVITADGAGAYLRVAKPDSGTVIGSTVSEGIGYGMLLSVYMGDQEVFDNLWQYARQYFDDNGLMNWEVSPDGGVIGSGAALDGDEDMAWALLMAARQWGTGSALTESYSADAVALINAIWEHEIDHQRNEMPLPGDSWGGADVTNISYFAPAYYRLFGEATENSAGWNQVIDTGYAILEASLTQSAGNADNGLVPAWCDSSGTPVQAYDGAPTHFQNDSTRTPFRIGQDYCYYGEARALGYMQKITSFYTAVGVENIVDGYDLDGTPHPEYSNNGTQAASFVGPAAVGAMYSSDNQSFLDAGYLAVATGELTAGTIYYQKSWAALSLLMMTGNFFELPAP